MCMFEFRTWYQWMLRHFLTAVEHQLFTRVRGLLVCSEIVTDQCGPRGGHGCGLLSRLLRPLLLLELVSLGYQGKSPYVVPWMVGPQMPHYFRYKAVCCHFRCKDAPWLRTHEDCLFSNPPIKSNLLTFSKSYFLMVSFSIIHVPTHVHGQGFAIFYWSCLVKCWFCALVLCPCACMLYELRKWSSTTQF